MFAIRARRKVTEQLVLLVCDTGIVYVVLSVSNYTYCFSFKIILLFLAKCVVCYLSTLVYAIQPYSCNEGWMSCFCYSRGLDH